VKISARFAELRSQQQMAFMPFVTAGDPDLETTVAAIRELAARGVDLIEIGFPYSDPIADGPVIQASYTRALQRHVHVDQIFAAIKSVTSGPDGTTAFQGRRGETIAQRTALEDRPTKEADAVKCPLLAMVAFSIVFRVGVERFLKQASDAGFAGLIVPDLPGDEAAEFFAATRDAGLDLIQLVAPTTPADRVERILSHCSGFVYCVSVAGVTGVRDELPETLKGQLAELRSKTDLPLAVGFGISRPEQVAPLQGLADGVIVGSAIVRQLAAIEAEGKPSANAIRSVGEFAAAMAAAAHST
jgi:tryptophan synthase alpha chain